MTRVIITVGLFLALVLLFLLSNREKYLNHKNIILLSPLILGIIMYFGIHILDTISLKLKIISLYGCDGGALFLILISFILIAIGLVINIPRLIVFLYKKIFIKSKTL